MLWFLTFFSPNCPNCTSSPWSTCLCKRASLLHTITEPENGCQTDHVKSCMAPGPYFMTFFLKLRKINSVSLLASYGFSFVVASVSTSGLRLRITGLSFLIEKPASSTWRSYFHSFIMKTFPPPHFSISVFLAVIIFIYLIFGK